MNVWIVSEGEKKGPYADYEVRRRILEGEYSAETVGWHEGCAEWMPLSRMPMFEREFERWPEEDFEVEAAQEQVGAGAAVPGSTDGWSPGVYWMRRFWARWLDLHLFAGVLWIGLYLGGADVGALLRNLWFMLLIYLPWVPVEAYFISRYGTTPGKWLAGLRVVRPGGEKAAYGPSLIRAMRVYFLGIGMGWGVVSLICQTIGFFTVRAAGRAVWDREGYHVVESLRWRKRRGLVLAVVYFLVTQMQWMVVAPYFLEDFAKRNPQWKEWLEKNPPRHLPRKG